LFLYLLQACSLFEFGVSQARLNSKLALNGLITNDKFCLTRWDQLVLGVDCRPRHRR
jgi:hypothetical protein